MAKDDKVPKKDAQKNNSKVIKSLQKLNQTFTDFVSDMRYNTTGSSLEREKELERLNAGIDNILHKEIADMGEFTGQDVSTFLYKLLNDHERERGSNIKSAEDIFTSQDGQTVIQFFYERYKNRNLLYEDLNMVSEQLFQLNEAIMATRDAIVTSDDMSKLVSRQLDFHNNTLVNNEKDNYIATVEAMEKEHKLLLKLKDHIIPKTLTYGSYFVYTVPYSKLFEGFEKKKQEDAAKNPTFKTTKTTEAASLVTESGIELIDESFITDFKKDNNIPTVDVKKVVTEVNEYLSNITIIKNEMGIPVVEGVDISALADHLDMDENLASAMKDVKKKSKDKGKDKGNVTYSDGTVDLKIKTSDFSGVSGCYIKTLDPRKVIPIKIMDTVLGYYYLHEAPMQMKTSFTTNITIGPSSSKMFSSGPEQLEHQFLSRITDRIVKSFDKKFLETNVQFKELILNCLRYNDLYKKQIKFEFIPVDYITEFKINEDENGNGVSVLYRSLFYAKLYLAILIFKMITIITRSTDTRIYYVKNSGFDQDITNQLQQTARSIKEKQINFMDLMSYQSIVLI